MKRAISLLLALIMVVTLLPLSALAAETNEPEISVKSTYASPGSTVFVTADIKNNPGIISTKLTIAFDDALTLVGATAGDAFAALTMTPPKQLSTVGSISESCNFAWFSSDIAEEDIKDGTILTLEFAVAEDAELNEDYNISITCEDGDVIDKNGDAIAIKTGTGSITIIDYMPGDVNQDGRINNKDVVMLSQYIVDGCQYDEAGYAVAINDAAADVNADGKINMQDVVLISRYIVDGCITDPEGYNVEFKVAHKACQHELTAVEAVAATCTEEGGIAYWHCTKCDKYYSDAECKSRIELENTVIPAKGHTVVEDPAVPARIGIAGLTRGEHCSACGEILIAQEETDPLKAHEHNIIFDVANGDSYLNGLINKGKLDSNNPAVYTEEEGLTLKNPSAEGYRFLGWYDGTSASNSNKVTRIEKGSTEDVYLYGIWEKIEYTVQLQSDIFVDKDEMTYTVDKGVSLPTPSLSSYVFTGWCDEEGKLYNNNRIPAGTTGNIVLTANWTSERYKAYTKTKLDEPIIVEDKDNDVLLFAYEIGEIQNVPLYTIKDFGYIAGDGITKSETETFSMKISESEMSAYAKAVSSATTESSSWTLSDSWNQSTAVNEGWAEEHNISKEEQKTVGRSDSNNWNVSSGSSGSTDTTVLDTNQDGWENQAKVNGSDSSSHSSTSGHEDTLNQTAQIDATLNTRAGTKTNYLDATVSAGYSKEWGEKNTSSTTDSNSSTNGYEIGGKDSHTGLHTNSTVTNSSWNSSSSYGGSSTTSQTQTTSTKVADSIAKTYEQNTAYSISGATSNTSGLAKEQKASDEYSASVSYSTETQDEITRSWTTQATKPGYHRWVIAGTAHVFAIVGYDMAEKAFFVYTYSVIDDNTYEFEDYSCSTASYNDHQNSVINFEIPYEVSEYVGSRTLYSKGLEVDQETGIITKYTGDDNCVVIPEYMNIGNGEVVKVTGIDPEAFQGNKNIKGVVLSDFITEIPDSAFEGCTSLSYIEGGNIDTIGQKAFFNCTSMEQFGVTNNIVSVGKEAFTGIDTLRVNPANAEVFDNALTSKVNQLEIYVNNIDGGPEALSGKTINIPETVKVFAFNGCGKSYQDLTIKSNAEQTYINKANFVSSQQIPLQINSDNLVLNQVSVTAEGIAMALTSDNTEIGLQSNIRMTSNNENAIVCKDISLYKYNENADGKITASDNICVCGEIEGRNLLNVKDEQIITIDNDQFEYLLSSYRIYFYPEEGTCDETSRTVANGTEVGELPTPTRANYVFDGWYLNDGTKVTKDTKFSSGNDVKLYAHWKVADFTISWNEGTGYTINVERTNSPYEKADLVTINSGDKVFYGDELSVTYSPKTGYSITSNGKTYFSVTKNVDSSEIYAEASVNKYSVSWNTGTGYTIAVTRTSSPYQNAATGALSVNDPIFYGDVLSVKYAAATGYTLGSTGETSITVTGNITKDDIYASATPKNYTYNVVYKSTNGTALGTSTVTKAFGTTNTITAPAKTGYTTPSSQSVKWDSTTAKTITFKYAPKSVSTSQSAASGWWWQGNSSGTGVSYVASLEYQNRTSTSVQIRVKWVQSIKSAAYGYNQYFNATIGGTSTGDVTIATTSTWPYVSSSGPWHTGSVTKYSPWITVSVSATTTSVYVSAKWWGSSHSGSWSKTMSIPTY